MKKPLILCILDGYALNKKYPGNAIKLAKKPNLDKIFASYKGIQLVTWGEAVGLPEGQMGNSEVGHMNIGAGRIVYQSLTMIDQSIKKGEFELKKSFKKVFDHVKKNNSILHLLGLYSIGGVHSSDQHFHELIRIASKADVKEIYLHLFLDGRDTPPKSAASYIQNLLKIIKKYPKVKIAFLSGRYYAMDRDRRWKRTNLAYDSMTLHEGQSFSDPIQYITNNYQDEITDEFVIPAYNTKTRTINDDDGIIFVNFRPDRAIQLSATFTNKNYVNQPKKVIKNLFFVSMMDYGPTVMPDEIAFPLTKLTNTIGKIIAQENLSQLRIAETEKYAHVTFFFDGGEHIELKNMQKVLIHSPKVATYDLQPEMSAFKITEALLELMPKFDVIILNFANCDMVGHTGSIPACIKAVEAVDKCVFMIYKKCLELSGTMIITADHGNADEMLDEHKNIVTKHSMNPVPFFVLSKNIQYIKQIGKLADIAPTMLKLLGIKIPEEMTGDVLIK